MGAPPNKSYKHINTTQAGLLISGNSGTCLGSVVINTAGTGGGSVLTIFDDVSAVAANTVAVCNTQNTAIPSLTYDLALSRGLFITLTAGTTTQSDLTITYD